MALTADLWILYSAKGTSFGKLSMSQTLTVSSLPPLISFPSGEEYFKQQIWKSVFSRCYTQKKLTSAE